MRVAHSTAQHVNVKFYIFQFKQQQHFMIVTLVIVTSLDYIPSSVQVREANVFRSLLKFLFRSPLEKGQPKSITWPPPEIVRLT